MLRIGEVTTGDHPVKVWNVHVGQNKHKLLLVLRTSKTHWTDKKSQIIKITSMGAFCERFLCPFQAVKDIISIRPIPWSKTEWFTSTTTSCKTCV